MMPKQSAWVLIAGTIGHFEIEKVNQLAGLQGFLDPQQRGLELAALTNYREAAVQVSDDRPQHEQPLRPPVFSGNPCTAQRPLAGFKRYLHESSAPSITRAGASKGL
jgi:hypothetical protein